MNYIDNNKFLELLIKYKKKNDRDAYEELGIMFLMIADHLLNHTWFMNRTQDVKDEMRSDAVYLMIRYIDRFDVKRKNAFAYFTQICWNAYLLYIKKMYIRNDRNLSLDVIDNLDYLNSDECNNNRLRLNHSSEKTKDVINKLEELIEMNLEDEQ